MAGEVNWYAPVTGPEAVAIAMGVVPEHADTAVAWNPSLKGGAKIEETYLVGTGEPELLTTCGGWELTPSTNGPQHTQPKVIQ